MRLVAARQDSEDSDSGFSLVELIVTVVILGIIVAIAIPFFFNAQDNARQAAVDTAARNANVLAQANIIQGDPTGGDLSSVESDTVEVTLADTFVLGDESTVCARADWIDGGDNYSISGPCDESDTTAPIIDREPDDPLYTQMTYQCPTTRSGYLGVVNVAEDTRAQIWDNSDRDGTIREVFYDAPPADFDLRYHTRKEILRTNLAEEAGSVEVANETIDQMLERAADAGVEREDISDYSLANTVRNTSELIEMEGRVTYKVRFDGEIETFTAPGHRGSEQDNAADSLADCLVSIDHFGDDINLKNIVYLGGKNLSYVPDSIPSSVVALRGAFENATYFNDPSVRTWDVSNVHTLRSMFYNTLAFNQDLNDWDTSNVVYMNTTFRAAMGFTHDLDGWDTSSVESMQRMFGRAENFNGDITGWDTSSVKNMQAMFDEARSFNRDISGWDVSSVEDYGIFNRESPLEDHHLPGFSDIT